MRSSSDPGFESISVDSMSEMGKLRPLFRWLRTAGIDLTSLTPENVFLHRQAGPLPFEDLGNGNRKVEDYVRLGLVKAAAQENEEIPESTLMAVLYKFRNQLPPPDMAQEYASFQEGDGKW